MDTWERLLVRLLHLRNWWWWWRWWITLECLLSSKLRVKPFTCTNSFILRNSPTSEVLSTAPLYWGENWTWKSMWILPQVCAAGRWWTQGFNPRKWFQERHRVQGEIGRWLSLAPAADWSVGANNSQAHKASDWGEAGRMVRWEDEDEMKKAIW